MHESIIYYKYIKKDAKVTQLKQKIMIQFGHLFSDRNANCIVIIYWCFILVNTTLFNVYVFTKVDSFQPIKIYIWLFSELIIPDKKFVYEARSPDQNAWAPYCQLSSEPYSPHRKSILLDFNILFYFIDSIVFKFCILFG